MDRNSFAIRALFRTLRDKLPAALAALDATRRAQVICSPGPYTIPAGATLIVNGVSYGLTAGARTAAQVAGELAAAEGWGASVDAGGALVLTSTVAPAAGLPSALAVGAGTANAALGLSEGDSDQVLVALSSPAVRFLERQLERSDVQMRLEPTVALNRDPFVPTMPLNSELADVQVRLLCMFPGPAGAVGGTLEAVKALAGAIYDVVAAGDGRGTYLVGGAYASDAQNQAVVARPGPMQIEPSVIDAMPNGAHIPIPVGQAFPAFTIQVFTPT